MVCKDLTCLICVYYKDSPVFLNEALESISSQTFLPFETIIVIDGFIGKDLLRVIDIFRNKIKIRTIFSKENNGLAYSLNLGISHTRTRFIARMDADDISLPTRFEEQISYLNLNNNVSCVGTWAYEFSEKIEMGVLKRMPVEYKKVKLVSKFRNPLIHPSVMFVVEDVKTVGSYPLFFNSQDYALWSLMLKNNYVIANIPKPLLRYRINGLLTERRGWKYFQNEIKVFIFKYRIREISFINFALLCFFYLIIRTSPFFLKKYIYTKFR